MEVLMRGCTSVGRLLLVRETKRVFPRSRPRSILHSVPESTTTNFCLEMLLKDQRVRLFSASLACASLKWDEKMNHYDVLEIRRTATSEEIRLAFLKLSKLYHPDINNNFDNHRQFVRINEAYSVLSRPLSRRDYDLSLDHVQSYVKQHGNASTYNYKSHGYGYARNQEHYYYHRGRVHEEGFSSSVSQDQEFNSGKQLLNFYSLTVFLTVAAVAFILQAMETIYPNVSPKSFIPSNDIEKHDLIMTSEHDGRKIFYYAIPSEEDPSKFEILAVAKKRNEQDSDEFEQLNNVLKSNDHRIVYKSYQSL